MFRKLTLTLLGLALAGIVLATPTELRAGTLEETSAQSFGIFGDVEYIQYKGRFFGSTSLGAFEVPFEIVAPLDLAFANGRVLLEPAHFVFPTGGRDLGLGGVLFTRGFSYAAIGFGDFGFNILDPTQAGLFLAGAPFVGTSIETEAITDIEIVAQFADALLDDPVANGILGPVDARYAFGFSQTARVLLRVLLRPLGQDLFDLTLLNIAPWRSALDPPELYDDFPLDFEPISGVGKVIFTESEGDLVVAGALSFRVAAVGPLADPDNYRVYEISGTPHSPFVNAPGLNRLSHVPITRAAFVAGDAWVVSGTAPPPSSLVAEVSAGVIDPIYGFETGIARDLDGNALGGVRLPEFEAGRGLYIASLINSGLPLALIGAFVDLACAPDPGAASDKPRFRSHGDYVRQIADQASVLRGQRLLLAEDAEALVNEAADSTIGKKGTCEG